MHSEASNVIGVRLKGDDFFVCIIIEDAQLEIVRAGDEPVLPRYESYTSHGYLRDLECLDQSARVMVVDIYAAIIQTSEKPGFCRMKVDCFDAVRALEELSLQKKVSISNHRE